MPSAKASSKASSKARPLALCSLVIVALAVFAVSLKPTADQFPPAGSAESKQPRSGYHYQSASEQALQDDAFANPGYLWVDKGKALFETQHPESPANTACIVCHADAGPWQSAATRYPEFDSKLQKVIPLETRINECRSRYQKLPALEWESEPLLALTAFVANQSKDREIAVTETSANAASLKRGKDYYHLRKGQLNLACRHCHELNPGRMLRGDRLSEGLPTGYPAYKLEWQTLGSLQRRLRNCDIGVRAEPHDFGSQIYADLSLYLKLRANGLPIDTPAVRR